MPENYYAFDDSSEANATLLGLTLSNSSGTVLQIQDLEVPITLSSPIYTNQGRKMSQIEFNLSSEEPMLYLSTPGDLKSGFIIHIDLDPRTPVAGFKYFVSFGSHPNATNYSQKGFVPRNSTDPYTDWNILVESESEETIKRNSGSVALLPLGK